MWIQVIREFIIYLLIGAWVSVQLKAWLDYHSGEEQSEGIKEMEKSEGPDSAERVKEFYKWWDLKGEKAEKEQQETLKALLKIIIANRAKKAQEEKEAQEKAAQEARDEKPAEKFDSANSDAKGGKISSNSGGKGDDGSGPFSGCDAAEAWQIGIQDPATPNLEGMIFFHNYLCFYLIAIVIFVCWLLGKIVVSYNNRSNPRANIFVHSSLLEIVWTIIPAIILLIIAVPSFALLYSIDELVDPLLTLKVVGHQWYWSYEYSDFVTLDGGESLDFDSYMIATDELSKGSFRLLEVDNRVVLPTNTHIRVLITAADVLHSWCVPSFGIKVDACPGRLTQASLFIKREGVYYGQCSEICGVNHGFMPIVVRAVSKDNFVKWVTAKLDSVVLS